MSGTCMEAFGKVLEALWIMFANCCLKVEGWYVLLLIPTLSITVFGVFCRWGVGDRRFSKCLMFAPGKE